MLALTLWQPWSWAVAHAGKRIENREWRPPAHVIGQRIAIHAGKRLDEDAVDFLRRSQRGETFLGRPGPRFAAALPEMYVHGAVEAVATVRGWLDRPPRDPAQATWWVGPCGWVLGDVVALPTSVPCRGARRLWYLPPDVERAVLEQVGAAS